MRRVKRLLETFFLALLSFPVAVLPYKLAVKVGGILGLLLFRLWGSRREIALENITKSMLSGALGTAGSPRDIIKESFRNFGRSFAEIAMIYYGLGDRVIGRVEIRGVENYRKAKALNKGVVFVTGHCGNWELLALAFGVKVDNISVVARAQNNPYLNAMIEKIRARYGNGVIYKRGALKGILSGLRKNGVIGILMDQAVLRDEGVIIDFLGRKAWTTKMPALISRKMDAPVLPAFIHRDGDRHVITIHPRIEPAQGRDADAALVEDTKRFSGFIEDYIRRHPAEWLWIHRRWKRVSKDEG